MHPYKQSDADTFSVQPFGSSLLPMTLPAQQIKDLLQQQFANCLGHGPAAPASPAHCCARGGKQPVPNLRRHQDAHVGMAVGHCGLQLGTGQVFQAGADARVGLAEGGKVGRQALGNRAGMGGDAQMALDAARELHHLAPVHAARH